MAQRSIPRPINPFLPPEMFSAAPIGAQPVPMQAPPMPQRAPPRGVPTTAEPMQGLSSGGGGSGLGRFTMPAAAAASATPSGGFMSNLKGGVNDFLGSNASLAMAAGLLGGGSTSQALGRGFGNAFQARQKEAPATTDDITEFAFARQSGYEGDFPTWMREQKMAGAQKTYGAPAAGMRYEYDEYGNPTQAIPIPGTEAALEAEAAAAKEEEQQGQAEVSTGVITSAAQRARDAAKARWAGAAGQPIAGLNPLTASAEASRQVEVLKAQAKAENLTAMRMASPTGAAMGNVSNADIQLLADKSGALDPSSPNFDRDVNDYEMTLLQVIHGPKVGKAIFDQTRHQDRPDVPADVTPEEWDAMNDQEKALWN